MKFKIKEIKSNELIEALVLPYYEFFEQLYGEYYTSSIIKGRILQGKRIPNFLSILDENYRLAQEAISQNSDKKGIHMMGVFDKDDILIAVGRMREVIVDNTQYTCISEIIPLSSIDISVLLEIVRALENYELEHGTSDVLSFETRVVDTDFQMVLDICGYTGEQLKHLGYTMMYDKQLNRKRSIN